MMTLAPKQKSMSRRTAFLCVTFILLSAIAHARQGSTREDELLLVVPADRLAEAVRLDAHLAVYQRLGDEVLVGIPASAARGLWRQQIPARIVDDAPWTGTYAVVSPHPGKSGSLAPAAPGLRVLYTSGGLYLVKGDRAVFDGLRREGFICIEISGKEIPPPPAPMRLPGSMRYDDSTASVIALIADTSVAAYIQGMQDFGTRVWSQPNRDSVFSWVYHRYLEQAISDVTYDSFTYSGTTQKNVIATIPGTVHPESEIIVGGHFDSANYSNPNLAPGADDNASGTTAGLEMARVLKLIDYQPAFTLRFIGFATEEAGLIGSAHYADLARQEGRDIMVMMNYDMLGYRNQGAPDRDYNIVWYTGSEAYSDLHAAMSEMYTTLNPVMSTSYRSSSDSWSFYQEGYHTLFCIETDFNPYYHSANDLLQYIDVPYATDIIRTGLAMLLTLDKIPKPVTGLQVFDRGDGTSMFAEWDPMDDGDIVGYNVSVGSAPGVYDTTYYQTEASRVISGLATGMTTYVGVSSLDMVGREGLIVEASGVPLVIPLAPTGVEVQQVSQDLQLFWNPNRELDMDGYNVYRSEDPGSGFAKVNTAPLQDTTWTDTTAVALTYYYVTAVDDASNESTPSDTVSGSPVTAVSSGESGVPVEFNLDQNYPNPFNSSTVIAYDLPRPGHVELVVVDILGREVARPVKEYRTAGRHVAYWDAGNVASGVYFYTIRTGDFTRTLRAVVLK